MKKISIDLKGKVMRWARIIEENMSLIASIRKPALDDLVKEMDEFTKKDRYTIIFYEDAKMEQCPKCDYGAGRIYQWLGRWYFMCINCAHGIPEPVLVDWGEYGKLNEEDNDNDENRDNETDK